MNLNQARLLLFAKAPQAGAVKTRLIPALGAQGACALARWRARCSAIPCGRRSPPRSVRSSCA